MAGLGGVIGTIIGWVGYQLGQRTDSADSAGSAHSKIKDIKDYLVNTVNPKVYDWKNTDAMTSKITINNDAYATVVNASGAGFLTGITAWPHGNRYSAAIIRVTIDGVLKFADFQIAYQQDVDPDYYWMTNIPTLLRFKTSLLVEAKSVSDTYSTNCDVLATYMLD